MAQQSIGAAYRAYCQNRHNTAKYRCLPEDRPPKEEQFINFSTNDYLGLSTSPSLLEAAFQAGKRYGLGSTGSRLLSGHCALFSQFEQRIAQDKHAEAVLLFSSGYQANFHVLSSLLDPKVLGGPALVFFDKLNHASLYQAVLGSRATLYRYPHLDLQHLETLLQHHARDPRPKFIVSETLYGMDGDLLPLEQIKILAERYDAFLYLDEAHATGLLGPQGYGLSETVDLSALPHLIMGTFGKALGASGAYIASSSELRHYLINHCSGWIYSTAPSPAIIGAAYAAWTQMPQMAVARRALFDQAQTLRTRLQALGFQTGNSRTPIVPILLQTEQRALAAQDFLKKRRILVSAIRPPTVPPNTARLRIAITCQHTPDHIERLIDTLIDSQQVASAL